MATLGLHKVSAVGSYISNGTVNVLDFLGWILYGHLIADLELCEFPGVLVIVHFCSALWFLQPVDLRLMIIAILARRTGDELADCLALVASGQGRAHLSSMECSCIAAASGRACPNRWIVLSMLLK